MTVATLVEVTVGGAAVADGGGVALGKFTAEAGVVAVDTTAAGLP